MNDNVIISASQYRPTRNPLDYLFFLRPTLHPPAWTILILGYFAGPAPLERFSNLYWLLLLSSGTMGWAYVINQIADIETDRANAKLFFLAEGLIPLRAAFLLAGFLLAATLAGAFIIGIAFGLIFFLGLVMGYVYSGPPFYGKNRPVAGTLLNGLAYGVLMYIAGFMGAGGELGKGLLNSIPYFFAVAAVFVGTTLPDIEGDKKVGKFTPGAALGMKESILLMNLFLAITMILSIIFGDFYLLAASGAGLPFYLYAAYRPQERHAVTAIKVSIFALSMAACLRFWPYVFGLLWLFVITRLYYRLRFGMIYPRLT